MQVYAHNWSGDGDCCAHIVVSADRHLAQSLVLLRGADALDRALHALLVLDLMAPQLRVTLWLWALTPPYQNYGCILRVTDGRWRVAGPDAYREAL
jgi:hypothetical protein